MPALAPDRIAHLLRPYLEEAPQPLPEALFEQLSLYLDLLLKWNARTNLTAIREPEQIVTRHFGESLFLASHLPSEVQTLLDLGSGAGFPGLPCQLLHPNLAITLAESQNKKAAFLQEVIRSLCLPTQVHAGRAESLISAHRFDLVTLRAVDRMEAALALAAELSPSRLILTTASELPSHAAQVQWPVPGTINGILALL